MKSVSLFFAAMLLTGCTAMPYATKVFEGAAELGRHAIQDLQDFGKCVYHSAKQDGTYEEHCTPHVQE